MLEKGANPNAYRKGTIPAFIQAIKNGDYNIVKILLNHGADVNVEFNDKDSLLCAYESGNQKIIDLLLWMDI